jgi:hypothetical protein
MSQTFEYNSSPRMKVRLETIDAVSSASLRPEIRGVADSR